MKRKIENQDWQNLYADIPDCVHIAADSALNRIHARKRRRTGFTAIAAAAAEIQTGGTLDAFVEAAREEAQRLNVPIADAYRVWNRLERSGADTTALLANAINHPIPEMHELFAEKIVGQMLG